MAKFQECQHVFSNGVTCKAPRLRDHRFCYFHVAARDRMRRQRLAAQHKVALQLPVLEDESTIQLALGDVVNAMLCDRIDAKKAALALYALQTASANLKTADFSKGESYREYYPEFDASLPVIEDEAEVGESPQTTKTPAAGVGGEGVRAGRKIPPKKPIARATAQKSCLTDILDRIKKHSAEAKRAEAAAGGAATNEGNR